MRIAGFDPGLRKTGWAVITQNYNQLSYVASGTIDVDSSETLALRLLTIRQHIASILQDYKPDSSAVEDMFVGKSSKSALKLAHARGVILCELSMFGLDVETYSPRSVKQTLTAHGNAQKEQVQFMIGQILPKAKPKTPDEADALAIAVCHAHHAVLHTLKRKVS